MSLALTGAGGQLGRRTAELLLERVDPTEVVLVTRSPERLADLTERGVEVRRGDFDAPETLAAAFAGVERLLIVSTDIIEGRAEQQQRAIDAAREAGVRHLVYTSLPDPSPDNPAVAAPSHGETEQAIRDSGLHFTFLRNALYSEYRVPGARSAGADGRFAHNFGEGRTAFVSREDCAAAAAAVLADGAAHEDAVYDITGPELIDADGLAAIYGELAGRPVQAIAVSDGDWIAGAEAAGVPAEAAAVIASFGRSIREDHLGQLSDAVETLTGRSPVALTDVLAAALA